MPIARCGVAQSPSLAPSYWKQRLFFIPYQSAGQGKLLDQIEKVQLLISRTGANDWQTLESAEPHVQGFSYLAPEDGEYWFALRHLDRRGQTWPSGVVQPQMRVVVDTVPPTLRLSAATESSTRIVIQYEARDANLQAESLRIEMLGADGNWSPVPLDKPDIAHPDRLLGRVVWPVPVGLRKVELRASVNDRAGHDKQTTTEIASRDGQPSRSAAPLTIPGPALGNPAAVSKNPFFSPQTSSQAPRRAVTNPFASASQLPSQDWPASNRLPQKQSAVSEQVPPTINPYTSASKRTPAQLVGDGPTSANINKRASASQARSQSLSVTPLGPDNAPTLIDRSPWPGPPPPTDEPQDNWTPAQTASAGAAQRVVNSRTFDVEYDLQSVGPWGVAKVELWGTHDNGQTWQSFGVDPDNRSPIRVTVPTDGQFGFRILVDGVNSAGSAPPRAGDEPELIVAVDLQPPTAELLATELGEGNLAGHLLVRWTATDTNLEPRPIALFYSSYPNGPWSTIASGLENTGSYTWRIERHVPGRFYLRLEARDTAGNEATFQTPTPVELARPKPAGRLRGVRSVGN